MILVVRFCKVTRQQRLFLYVNAQTRRTHIVFRKHNFIETFFTPLMASVPVKRSITAWTIYVA